jgi:hypothetical protein
MSDPPYSLIGPDGEPVDAGLSLAQAEEEREEAEREAQAQRVAQAEEDAERKREQDEAQEEKHKPLEAPPSLSPEGQDARYEDEAFPHGKPGDVPRDHDSEDVFMTNKEDVDRAGLSSWYEVVDDRGGTQGDPHHHGMHRMETAEPTDSSHPDTGDDD